MKANRSLLLALVTTLFLAFSLGAQDHSVPPEAISRLEASKTFGVTPAPANPSSSTGPAPVVTGKKEADISRLLDLNPLQNPIFDAPPPEALPQQPQQPQPRRRIDANVKGKDSDWLLKGVEEQQRLMDEQEKAGKDPSKKEFTDDPLKSNKPTDVADRDKKKEKDNHANGATYSSPFNSGLGVYSRYTLSGMEAMKQTRAPIDPLSIDNMNHNASLKPSFVPEDPATAASDATKIRSPIIDPLATVKLDSTTPNQASRLSVDDWLANVKERERAMLLPQQAPNVQDFYDKNQVRPKAAEPKLPPQPVVDTRPKANTMKNSLPPSRTIKDPNDF